MYCWSAVLTTIGTLMGTENYPMHGQDLHGLSSWTKDLQTVIPGSEGALRKDEQHPCQITCGQKCGQVCQTLLNNEKSKSVPSKNRNSTMCENYEDFTSLTRKTQSSRKPWKTQESWKFRWKQLCLVRSGKASTGRPVAILTIASPKLACIVEADESTRNRLEGTLPNDDDHIAGKGSHSLNHDKLVLKFILVPKVREIREAETAVDKEWEKLTKVQRSSCTPRFVKDDSVSYAIFTDQGSSASQVTTAKVLDIISRPPGCAGQAADAVSGYTQLKNGRCSTIIGNSQIRMSRQWPKSWSSMEDPVVPLERNLYGHPLSGLLWERQFEQVLLQHGWEEVPDCREKDYSCLCMWTISNSVERNRTLIRLGKSSWRCWFGRTNIIPSLRLLGLHSKRRKNQQRYYWQFPTISAGATGKLPSSVRLDANISTWSYDMGGHAKKYVERYCELANETTQQPYKVSTPCLDDRQFKEEEWGSVGELSKVCSQIVLKCLYLERIGRPDISWSATNLREQPQNVPELVMKAQHVWFLMSTSRVNWSNIVMCKTMLNSADWDYFKTLILWDTCPEPTELRWIGCSTELILTLKSKSYLLTPRTNMLVFWPKGSFTRDEWNNLLRFVNMGNFSSSNELQTMEKRTQDGTGEEIVLTSSRATMNLVSTKSIAGSITAQIFVCIEPTRTLRASSQNLSLVVSAGTLAARETNQDLASTGRPVSNDLDIYNVDSECQNNFQIS